MIADLAIVVLAALLGVVGFGRGLGAFVIFAAVAAVAGTVVGVAVAATGQGRLAGPSGMVGGLVAIFVLGAWLGDARDFLHRRKTLGEEPAVRVHRAVRGGVSGTLQRRVRRDLPMGRDRRDRTDRVLGALVGVVLALVIGWWAAAVFGVSPATPAARPTVRASRIVDALQGALSPTGPTAGALVRVGILPGLAEPDITVAAPDDASVLAPGVERAGRSVARITGELCGLDAFGSAWVVAPRTVATNAHVVAGMRTIEVRFADRTRGGRLAIVRARAIAYEPGHDVAVLQLPDTPAVRALRPLSVAPSPRRGTPAATVAFEYSRPGFSALPMRFDRTIDYTVVDVYGDEALESPVSVLRGEIVAGQSGAPVVDGGGRVLAMATASSTTTRAVGGYGVPASLVRSIANDAGNSAVSTGRCTADVRDLARERGL